MISRRPMSVRSYAVVGCVAIAMSTVCRADDAVKCAGAADRTFRAKLISTGKPRSTGSQSWRKHVILSVKKCYNVVAADFTGDGLTDVMANKVDATMLLVAPDWKLVEVEKTRGIHVYASGAMDVDADGDLDYVAGRYSPGLLFWLECPDGPAKQPWPFHVIDDRPDGVHGILLKDLDGDGRLDMVTNSAHRKGPLPQSILWYQVAKNSHDRWRRNVLGKGDASGRPHYFTSGDFNADGRLDVAVASSGVSLRGGDWLAWWEAPKKRSDLWKKHLIADGQVGATHLHPADFNGDVHRDPPAFNSKFGWTDGSIELAALRLQSSTASLPTRPGRPLPEQDFHPLEQRNCHGTRKPAHGSW